MKPPQLSKQALYEQGSENNRKINLAFQVQYNIWTQNIKFLKKRNVTFFSVFSVTLQLFTD